MDEIAKGVVVVGVGDGAGGTCERAYAAVAVVDLSFGSRVIHAFWDPVSLVPPRTAYKNRMHIP